jgi:hypothetical protein
MGRCDRFYYIFERHIGFGVRWCNFYYQLEISISIPFITFVIGLGKKNEDWW